MNIEQLEKLKSEVEALTAKALDRYATAESRARAVSRRMEIMHQIVELQEAPAEHTSSAAGQENVAHTVGILEAQKKVADLRKEIETAPAYRVAQLGGQIEAAEKALREAEGTPPPYILRGQKRVQKREEAARLRAQATAMQGSGEAHLQKQAEQMLEQADAISEELMSHG